MLHDDCHERIDRFTWGIVRRKVKQLIGRAGFTQQDHEDLEHEMILRLLQALPSFNAGKAHRNVFVTTVLERCVASILRDKRAEKRNHRDIGSLHEMIDIGEDREVEMAQTISQRELDARRGRQPSKQLTWPTPAPWHRPTRLLSEPSPARSSIRLLIMSWVRNRKRCPWAIHGSC